MLHNTETKHSAYSSKATDTLEGCSQETGHYKLNGNSVFIAAADQTRVLIIWWMIHRDDGVSNVKNIYWTWEQFKLDSAVYICT